ncbi:MAG: MFS transporter [Halanaeroarchaeum sp.]
MRLRGLARFDALLVTALIWFLAKFLRYAFPPLFGTLQTEYGVSNAVVGSAFTVLMLTYAAMQFPSGSLADRFGGVGVVVGGAVVAATGAIVLVLPLPFAALVGAMVLVGMGTGAHKTVAVRLMATIYPERTGRALGVLDTVGAFGGVVAPVVVVWALGNTPAGGGVADLGWHAMFLVAGVAGLLLATAFVRRVPRRLPDDGSDRSGGGGPADYAAIFRDRGFVAFVGATLGFSFAYNGAVAFLPLYMTDAADLSQTAASAIYSALFLVSLVQLATGEMSDLVGRLRVIGATLALATAGLAGLLLVEHPSPLVVGATVVAFGIGSHGYRPVRASYLVEAIPDDVRGGGLGIVRTGIMGVGAVAPAVVGIVTDVADYRTAFALLLASLVVALALVGVVAAIDRVATPGRGTA